MRSRALQACRPLRTSSSTLQSLRPLLPRSPSLAQSARTASRLSSTSSPNPQLKLRPRHASSKSIPASPAPASKRPPNNLKPASSEINGGIDPQAAILQPATVADVDPALASEIPTPDNSHGRSSSAFTAALTGAGTGTGNGAEGAAGQQAPQQAIDWSSSFQGLSTSPFSPETAAVLMQPLDAHDIEIKPDGIIYLPEIKYRRILNRAFGPGGWGLAPRGSLVVGEKVVTQEYALVVHGRFIAQARGECQYFSEETIPTAGEGCKSNALMRCCKDLGIASELWDPRFIRTFKKTHCKEVWVEHVATKKRRQIWIRKDEEPAYPYQLVRKTAASAAASAPGS